MDRKRKNPTVVKRMLNCYFYVLIWLTAHVNLEKSFCSGVFQVPFVLGAFAVGFLFQLSTYDSGPIFRPSTSSKKLIEYRISQISHRRNASYDEGNELIVRPYTVKEEKLWLQPKLLNLSFEWIQNNESICRRNANDSEDLRLMPVLIHSARSHFEERLAIRKTWGSLPTYKKWNLRLVFLLGEGTGKDGNPGREGQLEEEKRKLTEEQAKFGDVVIGSFMDSYRNLTYKHMMGYKWVLNFCRNATVVLKVDDDVSIDIIKWLNWLTADFKASEASASLSAPDVYCKVWARAQPFRVKSIKWYVSYEDYPEQYYPPFCSGWAYTTHVDLMEKVYLLSNSIKFNWIDDVFVTGQLFQLVKKKYNYPLKVKDLSGEFTMDPKVYRPMARCTKDNFTTGLKVIAKVDRGEFFERDMMCIWNKSLSENARLGETE